MVIRPDIAAFLAASLVLIFLCRRQLTDVRCHGFYRFWAFEIVLWQLLHNLPHWNRELISFHQALSTLLFTGSLYLLLAGIHILRKAGKRHKQDQDDKLFAFENTATLITDGVFRHVRHPMYGALLLFNWGVFLKNPGFSGLALAVAASGFLYLTGRTEEKENSLYFGPDYRHYMKSSRMFIPFVI